MPKFSNALFRQLKRDYQAGENLVPMSKRTGIAVSQLSTGLQIVGCKMRARGRAKKSKAPNVRVSDCAEEKPTK